MNFPFILRWNRTASDRPRRYRPELECLEDRNLLSTGFTQVNLASDVPGMTSVMDPNLVNPWGIAFSPTGPFWFANNGSGVSDLLDGRGQPVPLVVTVSAGSPTGIVFNGGDAYVISENGISAPSRFLFAAEDGTIAGWSAVVDPNRTLRAVDNSTIGAVYTGLALAADPAGPFLYAANFGRGTIDVFDQEFRSVVRPGSFHDPNLPGGFAPFNIQNINNLLFVTYAQQDQDRHDDVAGAGHGFIDVYDTRGELIRRFASQAVLNSPWGLALAPADFGPFGGALLVGNNGDGRINAYDPASGTFLGELADNNGIPIAIPNLWALAYGNGHAAGDSDTLFFAAGMDAADQGLFGAIQAPDRQGADTAGLGTFDPDAPDEPSDYPLPPRSGPAFRISDAERLLPISDLMPLTESSLGLVPTLSTLSLPEATLDAPASVTLNVGFPFTGPIVNSGPPTNISAFFHAVGSSQLVRSEGNGAVALNTFLDVDVSRLVPAQTAVAREVDFTASTVRASSSTLAGRNFPVEGLFAERRFEKPEILFGLEADSELLPALAQANVELAGTSLDAGVELADGDEEGRSWVESRRGDKWISPTHLLIILSSPVIWACWLNRGFLARVSTGSIYFIRSFKSLKLPIRGMAASVNRFSGSKTRPWRPAAVAPAKSLTRSSPT
jgi:uncharacterized protein (TIGR03118 family)